VGFCNKLGIERKTITVDTERTPENCATNLNALLLITVNDSVRWHDPRENVKLWRWRLRLCLAMHTNTTLGRCGIFR
jgi:hypothetical protein